MDVGRSDAEMHSWASTSLQVDVGVLIRCSTWLGAWCICFLDLSIGIGYAGIYNQISPSRQGDVCVLIRFQTSFGAWCTVLIDLLIGIVYIDFDRAQQLALDFIASFVSRTLFSTAPCQYICD